MTTLKFSRSVAGGIRGSPSRLGPTRSTNPLPAKRGEVGGGSLSHVTLATQLLEAVFAVLEPTGSLGDVLELSAPDLHQDIVDVLRRALDRRLAGTAAEAAITRAVALVVVQRHRRDRLALDVLPDVELGPV